MPHNCHDEHCDHGHSSDITPAIQNHLYQQIDFTGVRTLNEAHPGSGRQILEKPWDERMTEQPELESDADEQLILHIPFTGQVRLHSLHIRTSPSSCAPRTLHIHANNPDLDFSAAEQGARATQTVTLAQTTELQDVPVKRALFAACQSLALFFEDNFGDECTRVAYIGLKGDFMRLNREPVDFLYEAAARPSDHPVAGVKGDVGGMGMGGGSGGTRGFES